MPKCRFKYSDFKWVSVNSGTLRLLKKIIPASWLKSETVLSREDWIQGDNS